MKLHIVELSENAGAYLPDPEKVVARVEIESEKVKMDILNPDYKEDLKDLFSKPFYAFTQGVATRDGAFIDAGLHEIQPWDPEMLSVLHEKLSILGLNYIRID